MHSGKQSVVSMDCSATQELLNGWFTVSRVQSLTAAPKYLSTVLEECSIVHTKEQSIYLSTLPSTPRIEWWSTLHSKGGEEGCKGGEGVDDARRTSALDKHTSIYIPFIHHNQNIILYNFFLVFFFSFLSVMLYLVLYSTYSTLGTYLCTYLYRA